MRFCHAVRMFVIPVVLVIILSLLFAGSIFADEIKEVVGVALNDFTNGAWAVIAIPAHIKHKKVLFDVKNVSLSTGIPHEFVVIRTDLAPDQLPLQADGTGVEESQVEIVGRTARLLPGQSTELSFKLEKGDYVLICNVGSHYNNGMRTAFHVGKKDD